MQIETGGLAQLNGQQAVIDRVLANQESHKEVVVVRGPYGSGVSWTLDRCAENWEAEGGVALEAKGEAFARIIYLTKVLFPCIVGGHGS